MSVVPSRSPPGADRHEAWRSLRRQIGVFLISADDGRTARWMLAALTALLMIISGLNVLNSYVGRDFISAIEHRDHAAFLRQAWIYVGVFGLCTAAGGVSRLLEERLGLLWRDWQTRQLLGRYLDRRAYCRIESEGRLQNPDQRIAEDVRTFTTTTLSFFLLMLNATITTLSFSGVMWAISPRLFVAAVVYALAGSLLTALIGHRLVGLNVNQLDREADFRAELLQLRENADAIVLGARETQSSRRLLSRLGSLVHNSRRIISVNLRLNLFTNGYNYLIQIIPALVVAPLFMKGSVEFGVVTQSAVAFAFLTGAFSLAVTQFQSISSYSAVVTRLGGLIDSIDAAAQPAHPVLEVVEQGNELAFRRVTIRRGDGTPLVRNLSLELKRGDSLLIASPSGHAKVALFRATAGLDCDASGLILRPADGKLMFVPERPYLPRSTLRDLLRDGSGQVFADSDLERVLGWLQLTATAGEAGGLDVERDWGNAVGPSEQTRLLVARVLLSRPDFVFLDRLGLSLDPAQRERVLQMLEDEGITLIMLGDPADSTGHARHRLDLAGDGNWTLTAVQAAGAAAPSVTTTS